MRIIAEELEEMPLEAARAVAGVLSAQLEAFPITIMVNLTRDEAILALGLVNAVIESLELRAGMKP